MCVCVCVGNIRKNVSDLTVQLDTNPPELVCIAPVFTDQRIEEMKRNLTVGGWWLVVGGWWLVVDGFVFVFLVSKQLLQNWC